MKVGIVGLGLIGGSLAKAYKDADVTVFGIDKDDLVTQFATMAEAIDERLDDNNIKECDLILVAINPQEAVKWFKEKAPVISKKTVVIDCCGTKRTVCKACFEIADQYGLTYMGGHPMAGKEHGGFKHSSADLFKNAPFILVPKHHDDMELMCRVKKMILLAGFGRIGITTSDEHDEVIAFTSQMPHIVSNAFVKSKTALDESQVISAGSYQDFTRVAYLDEKMWTQLFLENKDYLGKEIKGLINELSKYVEAMENDDAETLMKLLAEGKEAKMAVLKKCGPEQINGE